MSKTFTWIFYNHCEETKEPTYGPHYWDDEQLIGKNMYHSLEDLMKTNLSDSIKNRLNKAKNGTLIKVMKYGTRDDLMLKCISDDEIIYLNKIMDIDNKLMLLNQEIIELEKEREKLNTKLLK